MPRKNRTVLRNYFRSGNMPREDHFQDLIDSSFNIVEEGFDRSPDTGFKISNMGTHDELFSFYKYSDPEKLHWKMRYTGETGQSIEWVTGDEVSKEKNGSVDNKLSESGPVSATPTLVLHQSGAVGIGRRDPRSTLDVAGFIRSEGRQGGVQLQVDASAQWTPITEPLEGCYGFEVTAGVGGAKRAGKYALMHAVALKTYSRRGWLSERIDRYRGIRITQASYRSRHHRLRLSWRPAVNEDGELLEGNKYQLFIKTNCPYGDEGEFQINIYLLRLWDDPHMNESRSVKILEHAVD